MKISEEELMNKFLRFAESELDVDNITLYKVEQEEWEELVNAFFTDRFYDIQDEEDLNELNEAETYIRRALKLNV